MHFEIGMKTDEPHGYLALKTRVWHNTKSMDAKTFFRELKRRNVYKVAAAYAVIAWLLIEVASVWLHINEARTSVIKVLAVLLALGFVVALFISWAFEATPQGG